MTISQGYDAPSDALRIRCGFTFDYAFDAVCPMHALWEPQAAYAPQRESVSDSIAALDRRTDALGNTVATGLVGPGTVQFAASWLVDVPSDPAPKLPDVAPVAPHQIDVDAYPYLFASRFADSDALAAPAWEAVAGCTTLRERADALVERANAALRFDYMTASPTLKASEALARGHGVCRDYAHLLIGMARAVNIPARYCSGFISDIALDPCKSDMDFSGWAELYHDGQWYAYDARFPDLRRARIKVAVGRDAADTAMMTVFGPARFIDMKVHAHQLGADGIIHPDTGLATRQRAEMRD